MSRLARELRLAARRLARRPGLALPALGAVALGAGALAASFGAVDATLLRPLPYPEPDRLVMLWESPVTDPEETYVTSFPNVLDWRRRVPELETVAAFSVWFPAWVREGEPTGRLLGAQVSEGFFAALGTAPVRGRTFLPEEHRPGAAPVVVLAYDLWQRRLGGDPAVLERTLELDGEPHRIVGVMPPGFRHPEPLYLEEPTVLWRPFALDAAALPRGQRFLRSLARLAPGVSREAADAALDQVASSLAADYPDTNRGLGVSVVPLRRQLTGDLERPLLLLMAAGAAVLLVAVGDLAVLLLASATARSRDWALSSALGAQPGDLARPVLAEAVCLALAGGLLGAVSGAAGARLLLAAAPTEIAGTVRFTADLRVLGITLAACLATALGAALPPALRAATRPPAAALSGGAAGVGAGGRRTSRLPALLVAVQVALALPLATGALLLARSTAELLAVPTGMRPEGVATLRLELPSGRYGSEPALRQAGAALLDRVRRGPGVEAAGLTSSLPLSGLYDITREATFDGEATGRPVGFRVVSPGALETLGVPLLAGRALGPGDDAGAPAVVLVNASLAHAVWGEERRAVGRTLAFGDGPPLQVVGVVGDVRHGALQVPPRPEVFVPFAQSPVRFATLVARGHGDAAALAAPLREAVAAVDPGLPVDAVGSLEATVLRAAAAARLRSRLAVGLATAALLLAGAGLLGVQAHANARRRRELAVRASVGARPGRLAGSVLGRGCLLAAAGLVPGLALTAAVGRLLGGLLFGVAPLDGVTLAASVGGVLLVAVAASVGPALTAAASDPAAALREP